MKYLDEKASTWKEHSYDSAALILITTYSALGQNGLEYTHSDQRTEYNDECVLQGDKVRCEISHFFKSLVVPRIHSKVTVIIFQNLKSERVEFHHEAEELIKITRHLIYIKQRCM